MPRKDESDDEAACDSDPVADASAFSEGSFAETTDAESESESLHDVSTVRGSYGLPLLMRK